MALISDLTAEVQAKLANRADVPARAPTWIKRSIQELTDNYPFRELETIGPAFQLTANVAEYALANFLNAGQEVSDLIGVFVFTDYPANTVVSFVPHRDINVVEPLSRFSGLPTTVTRHGDNLKFGAKPDKGYSCYAVYQRRHTFLPALADSPILMPPAWEEIIEYSAALRGAIELRMLDYVAMYKVILFGDPKKPGDVGIISARASQLSRDRSHNVAQMPMVVGRYGA